MGDERRIGSPDRRTRDVHEWLDEIERGYKRRSNENRALIEKFARWTAVILAALVIVQLGLGVLSISLLVRTSHQQVQTRNTVAAIQQQRIETIWDTCVSQNSRHDSTIKRLQKLVHGIKDPSEKARAEANIGGTISLINALAPHQDCKVILRQRFALTDDQLKQVVASLNRPAVPVTP